MKYHSYSNSCRKVSGVSITVTQFSELPLQYPPAQNFEHMVKYLIWGDQKTSDLSIHTCINPLVLIFIITSKFKI